VNYRRIVGTVVAALLVVVGAVSLAACGSSDKGGSSMKTGSASHATATLSEAKAAVASYLGKPSPFPVTEPLKKRPVGARVAYMDPGTPIGALLYQLMSPAAQAVGLKLYRVKAGSSAATIDAAYASVAEQKPAAVVDIGADPALFRSGIAKLKAAGVPILSTGVVEPAKYGFAGGVFGRESSETSGKLLADYVYAEHRGSTNAVFYFTPELAFAPIVKDAFATQMKALCPDCSVRVVSLSAASIGSKMPSQMVSDLQSHPDTKTVVVATTEMLTGVPAALKAAGLDVETTGSAGGPANLQMIKAGQQTSSLFVDFPVMMWTLVDMTARTIAKQPIPAEEAKGIPPMQFLRRQDVTFDPARGWTGYPDFAQRFMRLWGLK
jgi:ribose transport system substrate-binding protein